MGKKWTIKVVCTNGHKKPSKVGTFSIDTQSGEWMTYAIFASDVVAGRDYRDAPMRPSEFLCKRCGQKADIKWFFMMKLTEWLMNEKRSDLDIREAVDMAERMANYLDNWNDGAGYGVELPRSGHYPSKVNTHELDQIVFGIPNRSRNW